MRWSLALLALLAACQRAEPDYSAVFDGSGGRWIDLTHAFSGSTIYWPSDTAGFELEELAYGPTEGGWFRASYAFSAPEHGGTHLDAPIHFAEGRLTNDEIPLSGLMGPSAVLDVTEEATPDYLVRVEDLRSWESEYGELPDGGVLMIRTGWGARWGDRTEYLGTSLTGPEALSKLHFPGLGAEAAQWLADNRGIVAVGVDTPSIDRGQSADFSAQRILYAENISGFENVANLDLLPEVGAYVLALPMKIEGGSGGPLRIVAFVPAGSSQSR